MADGVTTAAVMKGCAAGVGHVGDLPSFVRVCFAGTRSPFEGQTAGASTGSASPRPAPQRVRCHASVAGGRQKAKTGARPTGD